MLCVINFLLGQTVSDSRDTGFHLALTKVDQKTKGACPQAQIG